MTFKKIYIYLEIFLLSELLYLLYCWLVSSKKYLKITGICNQALQSVNYI